MSMPASACFLTTSAIALLTRLAYSSASNGAPCSFARINASRSGGRGKLPTCVVSIRCVLVFVDRPRREASIFERNRVLADGEKPHRSGRYLGEPCLQGGHRRLHRHRLFGSILRTVLAHNKGRHLV